MFYDVGNQSYYQLRKDHLQNAVLLPTRLDMLELLPKNAIVAELGVAKGRFSEKIISITRPKTLHMIDNWKSKAFNRKAMLYVQKKFGDRITHGVVKIHHGNSAEILASFPDNYFDWVYIDTDHTYKTTKQELAMSRLKVKHGGIIAGHDYTTRHYSKIQKYGVVEAVNEFCFKHNWEFVFLTHETHRHLSFALKKIM